MKNVPDFAPLNSKKSAMKKRHQILTANTTLTLSLLLGLVAFSLNGSAQEPTQKANVQNVEEVNIVLSSANLEKAINKEMNDAGEHQTISRKTQTNTQSGSEAEKDQKQLPKPDLPSMNLGQRPDGKNCNSGSCSDTQTVRKNDHFELPNLTLSSLHSF